MKLKTFMLGWEFPPFISGGLGTACYGLTKALDGLGVGVIFLLPRISPSQYAGGIKMLSAQDIVKSEQVMSAEFKNVKFRTITSELQPYANPLSYHQTQLQQTKASVHISAGQTEIEFAASHYGGDMYSQVYRYAEKVTQIAASEDFDVVHAHDWMTYPAAIAAAKISAKPLVVQVHSTEFDRSGENINQMIYDIERQGMHCAHKIIAVSNYTKNIITSRYGISADRVEVVYNAIGNNGTNGSRAVCSTFNKNDRIVLFLGRITMQKGPEYFIAAAKKVLEKMDNVKFVMAGDGDMAHRMIELAARLRIGHKVFFTGFLRGEDVRKAYKMADLYIMPSVSEPFGIAPLEALQQNVPVLISRQSGISEVLTNALKVDFWDINEMANKIISVLRHPSLHQTLQKNGLEEIRRFRWEDSAAKVKRIYESVLN